MIDYKYLLECFKHYFDNKEKIDKRIDEWIEEEENDEIF